MTQNVESAGVGLGERHDRTLAQGVIDRLVPKLADVVDYMRTQDPNAKVHGARVIIEDPPWMTEDKQATPGFSDTQNAHSRRLPAN